MTDDIEDTLDDIDEKLDSIKDKLEDVPTEEDLEELFENLRGE